jgi:hypothetical protein
LKLYRAGPEQWPGAFQHWNFGYMLPFFKVLPIIIISSLILSAVSTSI